MSFFIRFLSLNIIFFLGANEFVEVIVNELLVVSLVKYEFRLLLPAWDKAGLFGKELGEVNFWLILKVLFFLPLLHKIRDHDNS